MNFFIGTISILFINVTFFRVAKGSTGDLNFPSRTPPSIIFVNSSEPTENSAKNKSQNEDRSWTRIEMDGSISTGEITLPQNYSKYRIPLGNFAKSEEGKLRKERVPVRISIFIRRFLEINEQTEEILLDTDLAMQWTDWDIAAYILRNNFSTQAGSAVEDITLAPEFLNDIWKPDVYIDEMSASGNASLLSRLITLKFLLKVNNNVDSGDVVYSARNTLRLRCPMDFKNYPVDTQTCVFHLRSYSYFDNQLKLRWSNEAIFLNDPSHANFDLQVATATPRPDSENTHFHVMENFSTYRTGRYSALRFTIKMRRKVTYHLVLTYLPSVLLILITWLCFLIPASMIEARIGISMTTVLTLTAMFTAVREQTPTVSYTMAIDIWMFFHIFFVFLVLSLFTLIYWMKIKRRRYNKILRNKNSLRKSENKEPCIDCDCDEDCETESEAEVEALYYQEMYHKIVTLTKRYAYWAFAFVYFLFLLIYWTWLLVSSEHLQWQMNPHFNQVSGRKYNIYSEEPPPEEKY